MPKLVVFLHIRKSMLLFTSIKPVCLVQSSGRTPHRTSQATLSCRSSPLSTAISPRTTS